MAARAVNIPRLWTLLALSAGAVLAQHAAAGPLAFEDVTTQRLDRTDMAVNYRFDALFPDFNNDGCPDAFVFSHGDAGASSRLWLNRCDGSGRFTYADNAVVRHHIGSPESPRISGWLARLDYNGDGRQDFWGRDGYATAARYLNGTAAGSFTPVFSGKSEACDDYCVFADITGTGDLQVVRRNRRVENIMTRAQILPAAGTEAHQTVGDIDGDGWPEIIQPVARGYWRNNRGTLSWQPVPAFEGTGDGIELMTLGDFDNDGDLDLFFINGANDIGGGRAYLFANDGRGGFSDVTASSGLAGLRSLDYMTNYGNTLVGDFDNDGRQDLLIAGISHASSARVFRNEGGLRFSAPALDFGPSDGTGANGYESGKQRADAADFDNDGRLDIVKVQHPRNIGLWRNTTDTDGNRWMKVRVRGGGGNSDGVGASVRWYRAGTNTLVAHMHVAVGEQHPQTHLHTGLGGNATVDLEVRFPSGGPTLRFTNVASNQEVIVYRDGCMLTGWQPGSGWPLESPANCSFSGGTRSRRNGATPLATPGTSPSTRAATTPATTRRAPAAQSVGTPVPVGTAATTLAPVQATRADVRITPTVVVLWRTLRHWFDRLFQQEPREQR